MEKPYVYMYMRVYAYMHIGNVGVNTYMHIGMYANPACMYTGPHIQNWRHEVEMWLLKE